MTGRRMSSLAKDFAYSATVMRLDGICQFSSDGATVRLNGLLEFGGIGATFAERHLVVFLVADLAGRIGGGAVRLAERRRALRGELGHQLFESLDDAGGHQHSAELLGVGLADHAGQKRVERGDA